MTAAPSSSAVSSGVRSLALRRSAAAAGGILSVTCGVAALVLHVIHDGIWPGDLDPYWRSAVVWSIVLGGPGAVLAWLRPANAVAWLVLAAGLALGIGEAMFAWSVVALDVPSADLWYSPMLVWIGSWIWAPGYVLVPTVVLLLIPEGAPPSRRWQPVLYVQLLVIVLATIGFALAPWDRVDPPVTWRGLTNPFGVPGAERLVTLTLPLVGLSVVASVVSLAIRLRNSASAERQQLKWVLLGAVLTVVLAASAFVAPGAWSQWVAALSVLPLVAGTTVAVLRHRLWDVEAFIARSAIYLALTLLVAVTYIVVVGLVGTRVGGTGAPLLALLLVAVGLQPVRTALQRQVNRLLYGQRDDPYAVLTTLGQRLEGAAAAQPGGEALPDVARTISDALRLPYVGVVVDGDVVSSTGVRPSVVETFPLVHRGEQVGALEIAPRRGESHIGRQDQQLLGDLTRQLGGAAISVLLTRDLVESRRAIVNAREEERRRLHRDVHDDLGPRLAALALQLETARDLVATDPQQARNVLGQLTGHVRDAVAVTRRIVTDLRPVILDDLGVTGALDELAERFTSAQLSVRTVLDDPGEVSAAVEVMILRVAAESIANVARHSEADECRIELRRRGHEIQLCITDNGRGIPDDVVQGVGLRSMRERVAELGGRCGVKRLAGGGTRVMATVPLGPR